MGSRTGGSICPLASLFVRGIVEFGDVWFVSIRFGRSRGASQRYIDEH